LYLRTGNPRHEQQHVKNFFQVASLLMLLVAVALLAAITTMHFAIHGAEVQVPELKGMTVVDARNHRGVGTEPGCGQSLLFGRRGRGHILTQSPAAGTWYVARGACAWRRAWAAKSGSAGHGGPGGTRGGAGIAARRA